MVSHFTFLTTSQWFLPKWIKSRSGDLISENHFGAIASMVLGSTLPKGANLFYVCQSFANSPEVSQTHQKNLWNRIGKLYLNIFCTPSNLNIFYRLFMKFTQVKAYQDYDQFAIKPYVFLESYFMCFKLPRCWKVKNNLIRLTSFSDRCGNIDDWL